MTVAELLLKIANSLGGLFASSSNLKRARQYDLANLLERISVSVIAAAEKLERDIEPTEECAELFSYSQHLLMTLRRVMGFFGSRKVKRLVRVLESATDAPFNAVVNLSSKSTIIKPIFARDKQSSDAETEIRCMKEAGGAFRAAAELIRSGGTYKA